MLKYSVELVETMITERKFEANTNATGFVIFHVSLIETLMFCHTLIAAHRHQDSDTL